MASHADRSDAFMQSYTSLVQKYSPGWTETMRRDQPGSPLDLPGFFGGSYQRTTYAIQQLMDWNSLSGRTLSIAHVPQPGDLTHQLMFLQLHDIFDCYQNNGQVAIQYETELYFGRLK